MIGGVFAGTVLAVLFVPLFLLLVLRLFGARRKEAATTVPAASLHAPAE